MDANINFIAKNSTKNFSIMPLCIFLNVRHGDRPASHWESMTEVKSEVKIMAVSCAWSQRPMSYFVGPLVEVWN